MKVVIIQTSTSEKSYFDSEIKNEIKTFFKSADLKNGDLVKYNKSYPLHLLRREGESFGFDISYCTPGSAEYIEHGEYTFKVLDRIYLKETDTLTELLTEENFESLKVCDKIYKINGTSSRGFRVVGRMPESNNYLILSDGEHLEYLYIPNHVTKENVEHKSIRWFTGKYDSKVIGQIMLDNIDKKRESIERIYIKDED